ncbi:hypothetical protein [Mycolicibacterium doricum]|nr:hypothetical protein [Mycolicibacterium doricum]
MVLVVALVTAVVDAVTGLVRETVASCVYLIELTWWPPAPGNCY